MSRLCTDTDISTSWLILEIMNSDNFMIWTGFGGCRTGSGWCGSAGAKACRGLQGCAGS